MILVDSADLNVLKNSLKLPYLSGFTSNPNLMAQALTQDAISYNKYIDHALELCNLRSLGINLPNFQIMIQGIGTPEQISSQASQYIDIIKSQNIEADLWIKLMPNEYSLATIRELNKIGCKTLVTAVFTATQALLAMEAGADGIAVYLGRMMKYEKQWESHIEKITRVMNSAKKMLLMASFPDVETVEKALNYSMDLTIPPRLLDSLLSSSYTEEAGKNFDGKIILS